LLCDVALCLRQSGQLLRLQPKLMSCVHALLYISMHLMSHGRCRQGMCLLCQLLSLSRLLYCSCCYLFLLQRPCWQRVLHRLQTDLLRDLCQPGCCDTKPLRARCQLLLCLPHCVSLQAVVQLRQRAVCDGRCVRARVAGLWRHQCVQARLGAPMAPFEALVHLGRALAELGTASDSCTGCCYAACCKRQHGNTVEQGQRLFQLLHHKHAPTLRAEVGCPNQLHASSLQPILSWLPRRQ
jgi:hypothetical protein